MLLESQGSCLILVDVQEKLLPHVHEYQRLLVHCRWMLRLANEFMVPVLISEQYPKGLGSTESTLAQLVPHAPVMAKQDFSSAHDDECLAVIKEQSKQQVVLMGIESHVCVLQTALSLKQMGYHVFVVADAVSSRNEQDVDLALARMQQHGVNIVSREMVLFEWLRTSRHPKFKDVSELFLK